MVCAVAVTGAFPGQQQGHDDGNAEESHHGVGVGEHAARSALRRPSTDTRSSHKSQQPLWRETLIALFHGPVNADVSRDPSNGPSDVARETGPRIRMPDMLASRLAS